MVLSVIEVIAMCCEKCNGCIVTQIIAIALVSEFSNKGCSIRSILCSFTQTSTDEI